MEFEDQEFLSWSPDARYIFQERIGMMFGATPLNQCHPEGVESAREQARSFEFKRKRAEKALK